MIKYILYLLLIFCVMKIYRNKLKTDDKLICAVLSILLGIIIIDWITPKKYFEKFTQNINKK
jgi:hypothetical protein